MNRNDDDAKISRPRPCNGCAHHEMSSEWAIVTNVDKQSLRSCLASIDQPMHSDIATTTLIQCPASMCGLVDSDCIMIRLLTECEYDLWLILRRWSAVARCWSNITIATMLRTVVVRGNYIIYR